MPEGEIPVMRTVAEIREKLAQHEENLRLWRSSYLTPTEPEPEERTIAVKQLEAAIWTLKWTLGEED
jgi:hypothetical protein